MSLSETIVLGVVSGILTLVFIFLCVIIFTKIVIPWYGSIIYSGIDLSGLWEEVVDHDAATDKNKL